MGKDFRTYCQGERENIPVHGKVREDLRLDSPPSTPHTSVVPPKVMLSGSALAHLSPFGERDSDRGTSCSLPFTLSSRSHKHWPLLQPSLHSESLACLWTSGLDTETNDFL